MSRIDPVRYPVPEERPEALRGPEVGTLCLYKPLAGNRYGNDGMIVEVVERSYVWAPGDPAYRGGSRLYDSKVIRLGPSRTLLVQDSELVPLEVGGRIAGVVRPAICPECNRPSDHEPVAEDCLRSLDAKYHDHLPEGANCRLCGVDHAPINPSAEGYV